MTLPTNLITNREAVDDLAQALATGTQPVTDTGLVLQDRWLECGAQFLNTKGISQENDTTALRNMLLYDMLATYEPHVKAMNPHCVSVLEAACYYLATGKISNVFRQAGQEVVERRLPLEKAAFNLASMILDMEQGSTVRFAPQSAIAWWVADHQYGGEDPHRDSPESRLANIRAQHRAQVYVGFWERGQLPVVPVFRSPETSV